MKAVVQRVLEARVVSGGEVLGAIGRGLLCLVGAARGDTAERAAALGRKVARLRVFADGEGRMNLDAAAAGGEVLAVSQFTLLGDARKGNRPSFVDAAPPGEAEPLVEAFVAAVRAEGVPCATGRFGADMQVHLVNDGPVTILLEG